MEIRHNYLQRWRSRSSCFVILVSRGSNVFRLSLFPVPDACLLCDVSIIIRFPYQRVLTAAGITAKALLHAVTHCFSRCKSVTSVNLCLPLITAVLPWIPPWGRQHHISLLPRWHLYGARGRRWCERVCVTWHELYLSLCQKSAFKVQCVAGARRYRWKA